jgi:hypothetical protein
MYAATPVVPPLNEQQYNKAFNNTAQTTHAFNKLLLTQLLMLRKTLPSGCRTTLACQPK